MTKQKADNAINKIKLRANRINSIMKDICNDFLLHKDPKQVNYQDFTKAISKVHPFILKLFKNYQTIKQHHVASIGNEHINCQVFLNEHDMIRKVIVRNYHCEHMTSTIRGLIKN